ncbi:hypothetical protein BB561_003103 [Smittium simulii]|uniref:UBX domain-containing protein n=1 Tax=Smittium simulii TaxID=133385 RepID=A0A2T9YMX7_9FUNG|nr:hypothetical protein BB561_003103 [Smittium simulii]
MELNGSDELHIILSLIYPCKDLLQKSLEIFILVASLHFYSFTNYKVFIQLTATKMSTSLKVSYGINSQVLVKVTPAMTLKAVVEQVCSQDKKLGDSSNYTLKLKNKCLNLSLTVRFANLWQGANLTLVKAAKIGNLKVSVALQLPNGQRIQEQYSNTTSLKDIFETSTKTRIEDFVEFLSISILNVQYKGADTLSNTTLHSIGVDSGSILAKAHFENNKQLNVLIPKKDDGEIDNKNRLNSKVELSQKILELKVEPPQNLDESLMHEPTREDSDINQKKLDNSVKIIKQSNNLPNLVDVPDNFYNITPEEAKNLLKDNLTKQQESGFITKAERDKQAKIEIEKKKKKFSKTNIQFKLDDGTRLQKMFDSDEKASSLFTCVKELLTVDENEIKLYTLHPTKYIEKNEKKTLFEMKLYPSVLINVGSTKRKLDFSDVVPELSSQNGNQQEHGYSSIENKKPLDTIGIVSNNLNTPMHNVESSSGQRSDKSKTAQNNPKWLQSVAKHLFKK